MAFLPTSMFSPARRPRIWPLVFGLAAGIALARAGCGPQAGWLGLGVGVLGLAASLGRPAWRHGWWPLVLAWLACCGLGVLREGAARHRLPEQSILRWAGEESRLLRVEGEVAGPLRQAAAGDGALDRFGHHAATRHFMLRAQTVAAGGIRHRAEGLLQVTVKGDAGLAGVRPGARVAMVGWLSPLRGPANPGGFDFAEHARQNGIVAQLGVPDGGAATIRVLAPPPAWGLAAVRGRAADAALASLRAGLHGGDPARTALIEALLLGVRGGAMAGVWRDFRDAGLAHILAISGANVAIFLAGVWLFGRLAGGRPAQVAVVVVGMTGLFLLAVPDDMPVLRAGLMAVVLAAGYGLGRPLGGVQALGLAGLVLLFWQPQELFSPGFQLSFAAVAALFLFVRPIATRVEDWLAGALPVENPAKENRSPARNWWRRIRHWLVEGAVASVVVFLAVLPVLLFQFDQINPLAALFSMLAAPLAALLMWVGYAKVVLGVVWVPLGAGLAYPVEWLASALAAVAHGAAHGPGAAMPLVRPASGAWVLVGGGGLWLALAAWSGAWPLPVAASAGRRRWAVAGPWLVLSVALAWAAGEQWLAWRALRAGPGLRVHEMAVADGSCILLETREAAVLFDCGSRSLAHPGAQVAVPALRRLGVRRLDAIVVSHADLDHFGGMLDVADAFPVACAYLGPSVWDDAAGHRQGASAALLAGLRQRGIPCEQVRRGWFLPLGRDTLLEALWPMASFAPSHSDNDRSVVLRALCGRGGALFCADLEAAGLRGLLAAEPDLRADLADLPHHGGFVAESPRWLARVAPRAAVQSSSWARFESANSRRWGPLLAGLGAARWVTGRDGMVSAFFTPDGGLVKVAAFAPGRGRTPPGTDE